MTPARRSTGWWLALLGCLGVGLWLRAPTLEAGFRDDDYVQLSALRGDFPVARPAWDLFRFDGRDAAEQRALLDSGFHPWWTAPNLRLSMFRPLSSLLLAVDHALFGGDPWPYHVHSMLWWVALVVAAAYALHALLGPGPALLATALFAVDEALNVPVAWLANRSALVSGTFALLALGAYLRVASYSPQATPPGQPRRARWAAALWPVAALLAGEYACMLLPFIVAHARCHPPGTREDARRRWRAAAPAVGSTLLYLAVRALSGYGIAHSGFYLSPLHAPVAYAQAALVRIPTLLGGALFAVPVQLVREVRQVRATVLRPLLGEAAYAQLPTWETTRLLLGLLATALLLWGATTAPRRRRDQQPAGDWRLAALSLGILLSVLPAAGALPAPRVMLGAAFGCAALWALLATHAWHALRNAHGFRRLGGALLCGGVGVCHGLWPALLADAHARGFRDRAADMRAVSLDAPLPPAAGPHPTTPGVYVLSAADFTTETNLPYVRAVSGRGRPAFYRLLSGARHAHELHRKGDRVMELTVLSSPARLAFAGSVHRAADAPLRAGTQVQLPGVAVRVLAVAGGQPQRLRFTFDRSLDDPEFVLLQPTARGLVRITPPVVGARLRVPRPHPAPHRPRLPR